MDPKEVGCFQVVCYGYACTDKNSYAYIVVLCIN